MAREPFGSTPGGRLLTPPRLHTHVSGLFFVKFQGRFTYFGRDAVVARRDYAAWVRDVWAPAAAERAEAGATQAHLRHLGRAARARRPIAALVAQWLDRVQLDAGPDRGLAVRHYYATHIARFTHALGALTLRHATAEVLEALKADATRAGYAPRTVNHDLGAAKRFLTWAWDACPGAATPFNLRAVRKVHAGELPARGKEPAFVRRFIALVCAVEPDLEPWLSLQYLAALRPSEVPRLVLGLGDWHEPELGRFVFKMRGKTSARTRQARYIVLSPEALLWLDRARAGHSGGPGPRWKSADGYGHALGDLWADPPPAGVARDSRRRAALAALRRAFASSPGVHFLRHSAFDALLRARVPHAEARLLIGHAVPGSWPHYSPGAWHAWRNHMQALTLAGPPAATPATAPDPRPDPSPPT